jgi:serine/threonine-protein kinase
MSEQAPSEESIFAQAQEIRCAAERAAFLDRACGNNQALRAEVESLLRADERSGDLLDLPDQPAKTVDDPLSERPGTLIGPYKLLEQIGEGGFGVVFMAEQTQPVRRKVALKVLKPGMDTRQVVARFEAERQALALMDHPNIARVLDGGQTSSGRPYFVMDLVKGLPITEYCDQVQLTTHERLEVFVSLCQAVQHAHQKGVIHRDLKPSNVLVSVHDTTAVVKVIDFGVAKALGQELTDKTLFTGFAQMIGTPLYMSPEQAGQSGLDIDTRSDIYSLGVLLYELLTGTTPFDKERLKEVGYDELRRIIREEEPPRPSTRISTLAQAATTVAAQRKSDPKRLSQLFRGELDWIVMKCLEKDRNRRYETANGLAQDLQRYLHDEPVQACPPSATYRLRKFVRRNSRVLATLALLSVMLLAAVGVVAGSLGWVARDRAFKREAANEGARTARAAAARLQREGKWKAALAVVRQAQDLLASAGGDPELGRQLLDVGRDLEMAATLEEVRIRRADVVEGRLAVSRAAAEYARAFRDYGIDIDALDPAQAAERIRERAIRAELAAALDDWAVTCDALDDPTAKRLLEITRAADPNPWRDAVRAALADADREALTKVAMAIAASPEPDRLSPPTLTFLWLALLKVGDKERAPGVLRQGLSLYPDDFWLNHFLGIHWLLRGKSRQDREQAVRYLSVARALRPQSAGMHNNLGIALYKAGISAEAENSFRRAIEIDRNYARAWNSLGIALQDQGRPVEAEDAYRRAVQLEPGFAIARSNLGQLLTKRGQLAEAEAECRKALEHRPDLAAAHVNLANVLNKRARHAEAESEARQALKTDPDSAAAHIVLGDALSDQGKPTEAEKEFRKAIDLQPDNPSAHGDLANALEKQGRFIEAEAECRKALRIKADLPTVHDTLGIVLFHLGKFAESEAEARKALALQPNYPAALNNLGIVLDKLDKLDEAEKAFRKAIEIKPEYARGHSNLGLFLARRKRFADAEAECRQALRLEPNSAEAHHRLGDVLALQDKLVDAVAHLRKAVSFSPNDAPSLAMLGDVLRRQGHLPEAQTQVQKALAIAPNVAAYHDTLGIILRQRGNPVEAEEAARKAIQLDKNFARAYSSLGSALLEQKKHAAAVAAYQEAIRLKPTYAPAHYNLGQALADQAKFAQAEPHFRKAVGLDPDHAQAHCYLGLCLQYQGKFADALPELRRGHEMGSKRRGWRYPSEQWLHKCERLVALEARLPAILRGEAKPASPAEQVEFALLCQQRQERLYVTSARFFTEAFAADPKLAENLSAQPRYDAACAAALAADGQGQDAARLDAAERARLRDQALAWLRAELAAREGWLEKEPARARPQVLKALQRWQRDPDFNSVRGKQAIARLPKGERAEWETLWKDVAGLLVKARAAK